MLICWHNSLYRPGMPLHDFTISISTILHPRGIILPLRDKNQTSVCCISSVFFNNFNIHGIQWATIQHNLGHEWFSAFALWGCWLRVIDGVPRRGDPVTGELLRSQSSSLTNVPLTKDLSRDCSCNLQTVQQVVLDESIC